MRRLIVLAPLLAIGCNPYSSADNDMFVHLFSNAFIDTANSNASRTAKGKVSPAGLHTETSVSVDTTANCLDGGYMSLTGDITANVDPQTGFGSAFVGLTMTMTDCGADTADGTRWTVNGAPDLTFTGSISVPSGGYDFQFGGSYDVYNGPNLVQTCFVQASFTNGTLSGMWCGYPL